jgi:hypothetical protein
LLNHFIYHFILHWLLYSLLMHFIGHFIPCWYTSVSSFILAEPPLFQLEMTENDMSETKNN